MSAMIQPDVQAEIRRALASLVHQAKRCMPVTRRFLCVDEQPTEWDRRHADIDALLDDLIGR